MKRALAALLVVSTALVLAAPAGAAQPSTKRLAAQVKVLQKQVKQLQTVLVQTRTVAYAALFYGGCNTAATVDTLQGSGSGAGGFGTTPVNDYDTCKALSQLSRVTVVRQPAVATISVFQQLLSIFKP